MIKCDCLDHERHGHLDDCPLAEVEPLRARLAHAEACLAEKHLRLAEAEALLRRALNQSARVHADFATQIEAWLSPDSASMNMEPAPDGSRVLCVAEAMPDGSPPPATPEASRLWIGQNGATEAV